MTDYKGFQIDENFQIFKDGRQVFTAYYQKCLTMSECEILIDSSIMAKELQKTAFSRMPNLSRIDIAEMLEDENGAEKTEEAMAWCNRKAEEDLNKFENNY